MTPRSRSFRRSTRLALASLVLAACGADGNTGTGPGASTSPPAASSAPGTTATRTAGSTTPGTTASSRSGTNFLSGGLGIEVVEDGVDDEMTATLAATLEEAFSEVSAPGAVVAIRTADGTWSATIGATEIAGRDPMTADLQQRIGSVTKTFTVTLLLQLADQGRLSLDDPISKYVDGMPNPEATLRDLAAMRSGIPSYTFDEDFQRTLFTEPMTPWTPQELIDLVKGQEPNFEPGTSTEYSNTNTVLLGMVIEQVGGKPIEVLMKEQIIDRLGLTHTIFPTDATFPQPHATGYTVQGQDGNEPADASDWNPSWGWAAGAMISDLDDLLVYGKELVAGARLLSAEAQEARIDSFDFSIDGNSPARSYGVGLGLANGWYGHTGELPGYNTVVQHHLDEDITIVVMVNSDIRSGDCPADAPTTPGGRTTGPCEDPAVHLADELTAALGFPLVSP